MIGGYADFLYQIGMLDELESQYFKNQTDIIKKLIDQKQYVQAFKVSLCVYNLWKAFKYGISFKWLWHPLFLEPQNVWVHKSYMLAGVSFFIYNTVTWVNNMINGMIFNLHCHISWTKCGHEIGYFDTSKFGTPRKLVFAPSATFRWNMVIIVWYFIVTLTHVSFLV